jgi:predicted membrane-bound spermidine synthase
VAYDPINLEKILAGQFSKEFFLLYFLVPLILIFPATFMMGMSFPLIQKVIQIDEHRIGRHVGWLQTASYLGSVAGVITTAFIFFNSFGTVQSFKVVLLLSSLFLILLVFSPKKVVPGLCVLLLVVLIWKVPAVDHTWGKLHGVDEKWVFHAEDSSGLTVLRASIPDFSEAIVFSNGIGIGEIPYFNFHVLLGMLPIMLHPNAHEVAIIGLGSGGTLFSAAGAAETRSITLFEIVSSQKSVLDQYARIHKPTQSLMNQQRIHYEFGDARLLLRLKTKKYDVIETDPIRPDGGHSGNLYSIEYFNLLKNKLKPGGFAVNWAPTPRTAYTFIKAFPHVLYFWLPGAILIGSNEPIEWNPQAVKTKLKNEFSMKHYQLGGIQLESYMKQLEIEPQKFGPEFDRSRIVDFNTDLYPKDEYLVPQTEDFP